MSVALSEIRAMANSVFDALEAGGTRELSPSDGLYWCMDSGQCWDMTREPDLMTGDLEDDVLDIRKDLTEYQDIAAQNAWHTLDHFIGLLTALSYQYKRSNDLLEERVL
ncbi:hypothetical protein [Roseobacter ponti]|uniref:Uncharacterized protein n=1 Tax=Roseobacter ponti TaxID=1891787 RepID=A0A858SS60_9RHOB|nr:hypothetical protein [Roseobacter ponti]QJF51729.1 hypothetical protein G3256_11420 [Roseobacter ponti]